MTPATAGAAVIVAVGATGSATSDNLFHLAVALVGGAALVASTLAPSVYRDWRKERTRRRHLNDPATGEELQDLADQLREQLETVTESRDRHMANERDLRAELDGVIDDKHRLNGIITELKLEIMTRSKGDADA